MNGNRRRINTKAMFQNIIGHDDFRFEESREIEEKSQNKVEEKYIIEEKPKKTIVIKKEKNIQISIYVPPSLDKELSVQGALKEKESDKSAIARNGMEIVLGLSKDIYIRLKEEEKNKGISKSKIIEDALKKYLN